MRTFSARIPWWGLVGLALLGPASALASVVRGQNVTELTRKSAVVVRGTVVSQAQGRDSEAQRSVIVSQIQVVETWKGPRRDRLVVQQLGDLRDGQPRWSIPGDGRLHPGDEVVLFLASSDDAAPHTSFLSGLGMGVWHVTPGRSKIRQAAPDLTDLRIHGTQSLHVEGLSALRRQVRETR